MFRCNSLALFGVLVVRASDGEQGDGFYVLARDIGPLDSDDPAEEKKFRDSQIAQTIEYARNTERETSVIVDEPPITVHILQVND